MSINYSLRLWVSHADTRRFTSRRFWRLLITRRVRLKPDGTRWRTGREVKGKLANGVGSQYSHITSGHGASSITKADAHTSAASSQLKWRPRRFKWTRPFRRKTKSGFCACAITFQTQSTKVRLSVCTPRRHTDGISKRSVILILGTRWREWSASGNRQLFFRPEKHPTLIT